MSYAIADIEITLRDGSRLPPDRSEVEAWIRHAFGGQSCRAATLRSYRSGRVVARVEVDLSGIPADERGLLERHPDDVRLWRAFVERAFIGNAECVVSQVEVGRAPAGLAQK